MNIGDRHPRPGDRIDHGTHGAGIVRQVNANGTGFVLFDKDRDSKCWRRIWLADLRPEVLPATVTPKQVYPELIA